MKRILAVLTVIAAIMLTSEVSRAQGGLSPLVGSTHNYTITPESTSNLLTWSITEGAGYTINSQTVVTTTSVANITWTAAGTYHLRFSETNGTTCYTLKEVIVTVSANTFDVSVSAAAAFCNSATGQVNYAGTDATTQVTFTINMTTGSTFSPNWETKFTLTPGTATLANIAASSGTLTENAGTYTLTAIPSAAGTSSLTVTMDATGNIFTVQNVLLTITSAKELTYNTPDTDNTDWTATQTINDIPNTSSITTD